MLSGPVRYVLCTGLRRHALYAVQDTLDDNKKASAPQSLYVRIAIINSDSNAIAELVSI